MCPTATEELMQHTLYYPCADYPVCGLSTRGPELLTTIYEGGK
jgi:hypothetical protein